MFRDEAMRLAKLHLSYLFILLFCTIVKPSQLWKDGLVAFGNQQGSQYHKNMDKAHQIKTMLGPVIETSKRVWQNYEQIAEKYEFLSRCWQQIKDVAVHRQKRAGEKQMQKQIPGWDQAAYERHVADCQRHFSDYLQAKAIDMANHRSFSEAEAKARKAAKDALEMNRLAQWAVRGVQPARKWVEPEQRQKQKEEGEGEAREAKDSTPVKGTYFHIVDIKCLKTRLMLEIGKAMSKLSRNIGKGRIPGL